MKMEHLFAPLLYPGLLAGVMAGAAGVASAQESQWDYTAAVYLFTPETKTGIESLESTLSFKDAFENLDFAFMGAFEARNGKWSLIADYMYTDLGFSGSTPGDVFTGADVDLKTSVLNGYVAYRVFENQSTAVDLAGGFRWFETSTSITPKGGPPIPTQSVSEDWIDPVVAARVQVRFSDRWVGTGMLDYGGFRSDSESWQALFTVGYELNDAWVLRGGYRYLEVNRDIDGSDFSFSQSGPIFGASYRF